VTPEATRAVLDREAPGLAEEMRSAGRASTPFASISRGVTGTIGSTLVVNLPGSERGATEALTSILSLLPHVLDLLAGHTAHGDQEPRTGSTSEHVHDEEPAGTVDDELARRRGERQPVVVATAVGVHGNPPCRLGQKILLGPDGPVSGTLGCAEFDAAAVTDAPKVLAAGEAVTHRFEHELGSVEVFLEPFPVPAALVVVSATPVALHLARMARELGFDPVLVESRPERLTPEHRAAARVVTALDPSTLDDRAVAVCTDHDAPDVAETVAALLGSPARYVGVMGSTRHVGPHVERLRAMGFGSADIARVRTPVGLDLGARSAQEIALSILAGLVADRHGADGGWLDRRIPKD
jgi:xanthine/CO dehydrogenase XdhC/CoxF family maturation factor